MYCGKVVLGKGAERSGRARLPVVGKVLEVEVAVCLKPLVHGVRHATVRLDVEHRLVEGMDEAVHRLAVREHEVRVPELSLHYIF